ETLAVVGESGSGKSQAFLAIMGLLARNGRTGGRAMMGDVNLIGMAPDQLDRYRGKDIAMILQDPMTSLNPSLKVMTQLS
ncbi:MAG: transporter ATP-binding protein, partial [Devosia sp.]|nr:transporter ATP-binding protein [Devosia sp.]